MQTHLTFAFAAPDSKEELFVGHTDRYVGIYRWTSDFNRLELRHRITLDRQVRDRERKRVISHYHYPIDWFSFRYHDIRWAETGTRFASGRNLRPTGVH